MSPVTSATVLAIATILTYVGIYNINVSIYRNRNRIVDMVVFVAIATVLVIFIYFVYVWNLVPLERGALEVPLI